MRKLALIAVALTGCWTSAKPKADPKRELTPEEQRQQAIEEARTAGIIGSQHLQQGGAFATLSATGEISSGFDDVNVYGGLLDNPCSSNSGATGSGVGGGTGWGTIGTGKYGTIGHGAGKGTVTIGQPATQGDLDKAIIRRYIRQHLSKITACYEKELASKPTLAGTVNVSFLIKPDGTVGNSTGSGLPPVGACVAAVVEKIQFPSPKGGGSVQVNYPFEFRP